MVESHIADQQELLHDNLSEVIKLIILTAKPIQNFKEDAARKIELVEDVNGFRFVRRTYGRPSLKYISYSGYDFEHAWDLMHKNFQEVGIHIVPSFYIETAGSDLGEVTVVSEYLPDARPVIDASTDIKCELAASLGNLVYQSEVLPSFEMLMPDMFHLTHKLDGAEVLMLTDIDPYLRPAEQKNPDVKAGMDAAYIQRICYLFWDSWCKEVEREEVIRQFVEALAKSSNFAVMQDEITSKAFAYAHAMTQGVDMRSVS